MCGSNVANDEASLVTKGIDQRGSLVVVPRSGGPGLVVVGASAFAFGHMRTRRGRAIVRPIQPSAIAVVRAVG
jgi:hypothetical protein